MTQITDSDREAAEAIVAANIEKWGWGPLDEIEDLSEHKLAVDACAAGIAAMSAEIERLKGENETLKDSFKGLTLLHEAANATIDQLRTEKAAAVELLGVFASKAARYDTCDAYEIMDNVELWQCEGNAGMRVDITIGDLRAARTFLGQQKGEE